MDITEASNAERRRRARQMAQGLDIGGGGVEQHRNADLARRQQERVLQQAAAEPTASRPSSEAWLLVRVGATDRLRVRLSGQILRAYSSFEAATRALDLLYQSGVDDVELWPVPWGDR